MALHCIKNHESIYHKSERTRMTLLWTRSKHTETSSIENKLKTSGLEMTSISGVVVILALWIVTNKYMVVNPPRGQDVEWAYAFDVHLNAFFHS
ncbi:hypothetical protein C0Q70_06415 [Pomacea canaliculata]|uniref:Uncharacterized protein n=1 Tax=Pomacea canaliculata TaxID=400727 RepID=A0A2T7PNX8_POMCA|nr:hypothetical protein C0Q70_06415 [Pomacea canaliculata]